MTKPDMLRGNAQFLDPKFLFEYYWTKMGTARSYDGLRRYCISERIFNPYLGTPPNRMSIFKSMWRWACRKENFEESYAIVNGAMRDEGKFMSREEWKEFLREKVGPAYQHDAKGLKRFLKRNGYDIQSSSST